MGSPSVQRKAANKSHDGLSEPYPPALRGNSFFTIHGVNTTSLAIERGITKIFSGLLLVLCRNNLLKSASKEYIPKSIQSLAALAAISQSLIYRAKRAFIA